MTSGEVVNVWGSMLAFAGSLTFVLLYSLFARWWRDAVGRLLVIKALAIASFMAISLCSTVLRTDAEVLRTVRGVLAGLFGALMFYQACLVARVQIKGAHRDRT